MKYTYENLTEMFLRGDPIANKREDISFIDNALIVTGNKEEGQADIKVVIEPDGKSFTSWVKDESNVWDYEKKFSDYEEFVTWIYEF